MSKIKKTEVCNAMSSKKSDDEKDKRRIQNEALASFHLKLTDKPQKYQNASISDQSKIKLPCWDTFMQSISDAIRCLEHMHILGGPDKEQEIDGMVEWARKTGEGNLLLNRSASEEVIESLLSKYSSSSSSSESEQSKEEGVEDQEVSQEEEEEMEEREKEEYENVVEPLEPLQPLQPLQLQKEDSKDKEVPTP